MKGIKFDGNHSYDAYQLFLNSYSIGEAEPNTNLVEIPGVDGAVDFTEYFGGVTYKSRILKMQFTFTADRFGLNAAYAKLQNALNGRRVKIVLDDDKDYFYTGRVSVGELSPDGQIGKVTLTATCDPYKYKNKARTVTCSGHTVGKGVGTAGGTAATLIHASVTNAGGVPAVPTFNGDKDFYVTATERHTGGSSDTYLNESESLPSGKDTAISGVEIPAGATQEFGFCCVGEGDLTVTIKLQERSL